MITIVAHACVESTFYVFSISQTVYAYWLLIWTLDIGHINMSDQLEAATASFSNDILGT